jgi:hypothetical protein
MRQGIPGWIERCCELQERGSNVPNAHQDLSSQSVLSQKEPHGVVDVLLVLEKCLHATWLLSKPLLVVLFVHVARHWRFGALTRLPRLGVQYGGSGL